MLELLVMRMPVKPLTVRSLALLLLVMGLVGETAADQSANHWLEQMVSAMHQLNYDGVFVYSHAGHLQSMRIVHGTGSEGEKERLISLSGPSREIVRDSDKVVCYRPDEQTVVEESVNPGRSFPYKLPENLESLSNHYRIQLDGHKERIAGLPTRQLHIIPRDKLRYGHKLWLAEENGFLLRAELLNEAGEEVERVMFTSIRFYETLPQGLLIPEMDSQQMVWQRPPGEIDETVDQFSWQVSSIPEGFQLIMSRRHPITIQQQSFDIEHQVFSDGLSSISIFVEANDHGNSHFVGGSQMGAVSAFARIINGHRITVVGEVPIATVEFVAESVSIETP